MSKYESLGIVRFDHLEFAVGDLEKACELYLRMGFERVGHREIRERSLRSVLMGQNSLFILLTHSGQPSDPIAKFVAAHGDGVHAIAFLCNDAVSAAEIAVNRGALVVDSPKTYQKDFGTTHQAAIRAFGDTRHVFVSRQGNLFAQGFEVPTRTAQRGFHLDRIDKISSCVETGQLPAIRELYETVFGLGLGAESDAATLKYRSADGSIKLSFCEPSSTQPEVREFIEINHGAGVHRVDLASDNFFSTTKSMNQNGVWSNEKTPAEYYARTLAAYPDLQHLIPTLREYGVKIEADAPELICRGATSHLVGSFFYEIIGRFPKE